MNRTNPADVLSDPAALLNRVEQRLSPNGASATATVQGDAGESQGSVVLFLLTPCPFNRDGRF